MKEKIHPEYKETIITCTCGNVIKTKSTKQNIRVEICSKCHPFYTGQQKLVDTAGRVDKFKRKVEKVKKSKKSEKSKESKESKESEKSKESK